MMARISRHKSHRSHKHRDRSESEDEGNSRDTKPRAGEEEVRVSKVLDQEKRKSSPKDNGKVSGDRGKKRKDDDRWNGGGRDDDSRVEKESRKEGFDVLDLEKCSKLKSGSGRRREESSERNEEKKKPEKESGRRESSSIQYKAGKEKEKEKGKEREKEKGKEKEKENEKENEKDRERERVSEKDRKVQDSKHARSDDRATTKQGVEISELQGDMRKPEAEKELDRQNRRRDGCSDHDRVDDRKASYKDDHSKNGNHKDGRYKEKHKEDLDRDQRHREDKQRRDERSSRTHTSERSESKHYREENKTLESRDKKTKLRDSDRRKEAGGRKRYSDEIEDRDDVKRRSAKEPREETTKNNSRSNKLDSRADRVRSEHSHIDKGDSSLSHSRTKNSPNSSARVVKDQNRHSSRQPESSTRRDRVPESRSSEKAKVKDNIHSDTHTSPKQLTEKSPSTNERRSERSTPRRREYLAGKPVENDISQEISKRDHVPLGPPRLPPQPPNRYGSNSPSVLGFYEDEGRLQNGARYKRGRDASVGRGPGTPWKNSPPTWPSPIANGFMPLQHGPPILFGGRPPIRPYGWHNSVDPHMQMWDGNPNVWDQNRLLMSGRGWEMSNDNNVWNGQNGNVGMEFPPVPTPQKEQQLVADGGGIKPPSESSPRAPPKSVYGKAPELSKIPVVKGIYENVGYYLSKLDISPDLAQPDLYKQCMSVLGSGNRDATHNVSILGRRKVNHVESFRLVTKSGHYNSIFPTASDATYQRAMSLYRKQKEGDDVANNALAGDCMEEVENIAATEEMQCDNNKLCDGIVFTEGSEEGDAKIVAECRENNISRIHLSPESTH